MYTLRQYLTTLADTHGLTRTLGEIDVCRDEQGHMCYTAGNSAVVFRIRHKGRIRSLRCYTRPGRHLREIYGDRFLPRELFLYTSPESGVWVDVVLGEWIEGQTLHEAVAEAAPAGDTARLRRLAAAFDRMAAALTSDYWAHGDLKPENIVVDENGRMHLIDFDAVFLPAFAGEPSPELGTAAFQHPARTARDFDAALDDYPAALISTALHALALDPTLYARCHYADGLLFSPQQIHTDAALREVLALFERTCRAVQYRIARLLYAPTPRLFGLANLLAWAVREEEKRSGTDTVPESASPGTGDARPDDTGAADAGTGSAQSGDTVADTGASDTEAGSAGSGGTRSKSPGEGTPAGDSGNKGHGNISPHGNPAGSDNEKSDTAGTANPGTANPGATNPGTANPEIANPEIANPETTNPGIANPGITNPGITNPGAVNPEIADTPELFVENGLWGYRTPERIFIPPVYDCGFDFTEGLAAVKLGGTWHYIDSEGHPRIHCPGCEAVKPFRNGRARIVRNGRRLEIDREGREQESGPAVLSGQGK